MLVCGIMCLYLLFVTIIYGITGIKKIGDHKTNVAFYIYDKLCE